MSDPPLIGSDLVYEDNGELRPQDDVDIETFISMRDRAKLPLDGKGPPFFSGREAEIRVFREMLGDVERGFLTDSTYVIEGPPGAGKTALMAQCVSELTARRPTKEGRIWLPVVVHSSITSSASALGRQIDRGIACYMASPAGKAQRDRLLAEIEEMARGADVAEEPVVKEAVGIVKKSVGIVRRAKADQRDAAFARIAGQITGLLDRAGTGRAFTTAKRIFDRGFTITGFAIGPSRDVPNVTIADVVEDRHGAWDAYQTVLFIDEGQNTPDPGKASAGGSRSLSVIHEGRSGAPLSLCVFGLPGIWTALKRVGISRTVAERDIRLGELSDADCAKATSRCFRQFRVVNNEGWERAIVSRARRWPQHLAGYLVAAAKEFGRQQKTDAGYDAGSADFGRVIAAGDRTREEYYKQRAKSLAGSRLELAARLASVLRSSRGLSAWDTERMLIEMDRSMAKDKTREAFLSAAYSSGFLSYDEVEQHIFMPIPSFAGFLLKEAPEPVPDMLVSDRKGRYASKQASRQRRSRPKAVSMRP